MVSMPRNKSWRTDSCQETNGSKIIVVPMYLTSLCLVATIAIRENTFFPVKEFHVRPKGLCHEGGTTEEFEMETAFDIWLKLRC